MRRSCLEHGSHPLEHELQGKEGITPHHFWQEYLTSGLTSKKVGGEWARTDSNR
jgi:hypothetical protein